MFLSISRVTTTAVVLCIAAVSSAQEVTPLYDPINEDLQTAAADALMMSNQTAGLSICRYVSLYGVDAEKRNEGAMSVSVACHQLSHAGVPIKPSRISDTLLRLQMELYDPFSVGWAQGWEQVIPFDRRWHTGVGDGVVHEALLRLKGVVAWRTVSLVQQRGQQIVVSYNGSQITLSTPANYRTRVVKNSPVYGAWVDTKAAQQLADLTGSAGALLDARDFLYFSTHTPIYYTFRNSPKTLTEWRAKWGETEPGFGTFGVRGANLDKSGVTGIWRGIQRSRGVWETFDTDKSKEVTEDKNPFTFPDRTQKIDATEAFALMPNGGLDCWISGPTGQRIDAVPAAVAIDTSYGVRELRVGLSCWSCHTQAEGDDGFLDFRDQQTAKRAAAKDPLFAAKLAAYYSDVDRLQRDVVKDRSDFAAGVSACTNEGDATTSEAFTALNWMVAQVNDTPVGPERAVRELGLPPGIDPVHTLRTYLRGTTRDGLVDVMEGREVHFQRFRLAMPEAFERIRAHRAAQSVKIDKPPSDGEDENNAQPE